MADRDPNAVETISETFERIVAEQALLLSRLIEKRLMHATHEALTAMADEAGRGELLHPAALPKVGPTNPLISDVCPWCVSLERGPNRLEVIAFCADSAVAHEIATALNGLGTGINYLWGRTP